MDSTDFGILIERIGREADCEYVFVIGAAAAIPQLRERPGEVLTRTRDIDVILEVDERTINRVDFILGEGSNFDAQYGVYAQPVAFETPALAPVDWVSRTLALRCGSVTALCMEIHDLALSKYGAGRPKDLEFTEALVRENYLERTVLLDRLPHVECDENVRELMRGRIKRDFQQAGKPNEIDS